jgi:hypothetical protein
VINGFVKTLTILHSMHRCPNGAFKLSPCTLSGFDLTTLNSTDRDDAIRPVRQGKRHYFKKFSLKNYYSVPRLDSHDQSPQVETIPLDHAARVKSYFN